MSNERTTFITKIKSSIKLMLAGVIIPALFVGGALVPQHAAAADCDSNAVIRCGVSSVGDLMNKYNNGDGQNSAASIRAIFSAFGISAADIQAMRGNAQMGTVTSGGNVSVGNQLVATNAMTGGRQNMPGSTRHANGGVVFFTRPPRVSFRSSPLTAIVVMQNGVFKFAILTSCGNPVIGPPHKPPHKPPQPPTPPPHHPPKTPPPAPVKPSRVHNNVCSGNTTNTNGDNSSVASQGGNCSTNTTNTTTNNSTTVVQKSAEQQPPPTPPTATVTTQATPTTAATSVETTGSTEAPVAPAAETPATQATAGTSVLPNTGPGDIAAIFAVTSVIGTIGYRLVLGRYLRQL